MNKRTRSSPHRPVRIPTSRGKQVTICGQLIQKEGDIVCTLPPPITFPHNTHAAVVGRFDGGQIYAFIKQRDGDVQVWILQDSESP